MSTSKAPGRLSGCRWAAVLALAAGTVGLSAAPQDRWPGPKPPRPEHPPETAKQLAEKYGRNQKRVNGVKLAIEAKPAVVKGERVIEVAWTLDYTGPRHPLIVARPDLRAVTGSTLSVYYDGDDGFGWGVHFSPLHPGDLLLLSAADFARADGAKPITGTLRVSVDKLNVALKADGRKRPLQPGEAVWLRLHHTPLDRGDLYVGKREQDPILDAWTGDLSSNAVSVTLDPEEKR